MGVLFIITFLSTGSWSLTFQKLFFYPTIVPHYYTAISELLPCIPPVHIISDINKFKLSWGGPTCRPLSLGGKAVLQVVCRGHSEMGHLHELASSRHTPPALDNLLHPVQRTPNATSFLTQFYREWQTTCDAPTGEPP